MPRNSSGLYALPAGNPVVDGTLVSSTWANPTMADIAQQLNNVLTRDGLLGYTAPALFVNGIPSLPGISFAQQPSTGFYLTTTFMGVSYLGINVGSFDSTGYNGPIGGTTPNRGVFTELVTETPDLDTNSTVVPTTAFVQQLVENSLVPGAGAPRWVPATYNFGGVVWSPKNGLDYRCIANPTLVSAVDPGIDSTGWVVLTGDDSALWSLVWSN